MDGSSTDRTAAPADRSRGHPRVDDRRLRGARSRLELRLRQPPRRRDVRPRAGGPGRQAHLDRVPRRASASRSTGRTSRRCASSASWRSRTSTRRSGAGSTNRIYPSPDGADDLLPGHHRAEGRRAGARAQRGALPDARARFASVVWISDAEAQPTESETLERADRGGSERRRRTPTGSRPSTPTTSRASSSSVDQSRAASSADARRRPTASATADGSWRYVRARGVPVLEDGDGCASGSASSTTSPSRSRPRRRCAARRSRTR